MVQRGGRLRAAEGVLSAAILALASGPAAAASLATLTADAILRVDVSLFSGPADALFAAASLDRVSLEDDGGVAVFAGDSLAAQDGAGFTFFASLSGAVFGGNSVGGAVELAFGDFFLENASLTERIVVEITASGSLFAQAASTSPFAFASSDALIEINSLSGQVALLLSLGALSDLDPGPFSISFSETYLVDLLPATADTVSVLALATGELAVIPLPMAMVSLIGALAALGAVASASGARRA